MDVINCKQLKETWLSQHKQKVAQINEPISLLIIKANSDASSLKYVENKIRTCESCGIQTSLVEFLPEVTTQEVIDYINQWQHRYSAVIVQSPLYKHLDEYAIVNTIEPTKDCDCLTTINIGKLFAGKQSITPATPQGVIDMFQAIEYDLSGKEVLVVGRSLLFGKTFAELCNQNNATVTLAHSKSDLNKLKNQTYDVVVSAIGKDRYLDGFKAHMLVDVGINVDENGKMHGDFNLDKCESQWYTSVPNGVGQLTVASIVKNILICHELQNTDNNRSN